MTHIILKNEFPRIEPGNDRELVLMAVTHRHGWDMRGRDAKVDFIYQEAVKLSAGDSDKFRAMVKNYAEGNALRLPDAAAMEQETTPASTRHLVPA